MRPTVSQYAQALEELAESEASEKAAVIAKNLFGFLKRRGEGKKIGAILKRLEKIEAEKKGRVAVTVVTAHEASKDSKEKLVAKAQELFPGKQAELAYEIDAAVIGGVQFRTEEVLYDATLLSELKSLRAVLIK